MSFLEKLSRAAQVAGAKAGETLEAGRLHAKIRAEKQTIRACETQLGQMMWQRYAEGEAMPPDVAELCETIRDARTNIDAIKEAIEQLRQPAGFAEENTAEEPENGTACPVCGAPVAAESRFCAACGAKL
jgi:DNA repair exonuclease SbcCD ATPase subunit